MIILDGEEEEEEEEEEKEKEKGGGGGGGEGGGEGRREKKKGVCSWRLQQEGEREGEREGGRNGDITVMRKEFGKEKKLSFRVYVMPVSLDQVWGLVL